jgi:flagellar biosynthesis GTPase FlhF
MPSISSNKPYRIGRSRTGLGLFATRRIKKGTKIIRYFGPLLDSKKKKDDAIENKYLFELNNRWTIDGSVRENVARYINHACKPNAESDVRPRKRKVFIRAIRNIEPGDEINYDYGTDYFKAYLKPIGCKCAACEKKRKKKRAEARAERARLKAREQKKAERKAQKEVEKQAAKRARDKKAQAKSKAKATGKSAELKPDRKRKLDSRSKAPNVRLKAGVGRSKRKVADGVRRNGGVSLAAATPETVFASSNFVVPAANVEEAQQAST